MGGPVPALDDRARDCADRLSDADAVLHASHIDADGLTSGAIATTALRRAGIAVETVFEKQLDGPAIARIAASDYEVVLFTDFGSGQLDIITEYEAMPASLFLGALHRYRMAAPRISKVCGPLEADFILASYNCLMAWTLGYASGSASPISSPTITPRRFHMWLLKPESTSSCAQKSALSSFPRRISFCRADTTSSSQ
jgi:hypothetical protein